MRATAVVAALVAAVRVRAFDVYDVRVLASQLLPVGYTFGDGNTLKELSACRFLPTIGLLETNAAVFVDDNGAVVTGFVKATDSKVHVEPMTYSALDAPADSEGVAVGADGTVFVSTEMHDGDKKLDILEVDVSKGRVIGSPFEIPSKATAESRRNMGFEGLTLAPGAALGLSGAGAYVVTTTEYALAGAAERSHEVYAWALADADIEDPQPPKATLSYEASALATGAPLGVVEFEALERTLLVLERDYSTDLGNTIRLFEASPAGGAFSKRLVFQWDASGLKNRDGAERSALAVDNYEGMCLVPGGSSGRRRLLLVNDDNSNAAQIGTQFVLLELELGAFAPTPAPSSSSRPRRAVKEESGGAWRVAVIVMGVGVGLLLLAAAARYALARHRARAPIISGDPGVALSNLRFNAADLDIPFFSAWFPSKETEPLLCPFVLCVVVIVVSRLRLACCRDATLSAQAPRLPASPIRRQVVRARRPAAVERRAGGAGRARRGLPVNKIL